MKLRCSHIVVTGGAGGIGRAIAERLLRDGASVVIAGRHMDKLLAVKEETGSDRLFCMEWDVTDTEHAEDHLLEASGLMGGFDGLVNNAGLGGELVKRGEHTLHLYAANSTAGGIAVEEGTLVAETAGVMPSGTPVRVEHGATLRLPDDTPITLSSFAGSGTLAAATGGGIAVTVTNAVRASCADLFAGRYEAFPDDLVFAPGATFTITDPENLAAYSHSPAVTAFTARRVVGAPRLAFEGDVPPGSGTWSLAAKGGGRYTFGPVVGTLIMIK